MATGIRTKAVKGAVVVDKIQEKNKKPTMKDLNRHVAKKYATDWYDIGIELGLEISVLDNIQLDNPQQSITCFRKTLDKWLVLNTDDATWRTLEVALTNVNRAKLGLDPVDDVYGDDEEVDESISGIIPTEPSLAASDNDDTLDFTKYEDVSLAFSALFSRLQKEIKSYEDFLIIKNACVARANQKLSKEIKKTRDINSFFQLFAENKAYCNCLNIRFLEVIATASGKSKLKGIVHEYKRTIYSKTLREVWGHIPYQTVIKAKCYSTLQAKFNGKDPDNMTVEQLKNMCEPYLIKDIAMLITVIEEGSLRITWLIPTSAVYQAYLSALMIPQELRLDSYLQIGDWIAYHPLCVLHNLRKEHSLISPSTLLIGYYHSVLVRYINADLLMDKISSSGILASHGQEVILTGHSVHQRNWLLLEHVRQMEMQTLMKFCEFVQEILPQVGLQLIAALQSDTITTTELQCHSPDKESLVLKSVPMAYNPPSSLHMLFLDLFDQVKELLQLCDASLLVEKCQNLMASETYEINLVSDSYIQNLNNCSSSASLLQSLSFLFTWSDHSVLRALVSFNSEAVELLDEFDSFLDPLNTIVSYPICMFSLSMIPSEDSPYTILAIRCDKELWQCSLQYVFNIQSILVEVCDITQHCLQLLAIQSDPTIFYWNIPKCVVELISTGLLQHDEYLNLQGIDEMLVYPGKLIFINDDITVGSLAFTIKQESDAKDVQSQLQKDNLKSCQELIAVKANSNISYLRSELNKSKQLVEQFQETVAKAKDRGEEELSQKYDELKMAIVKDTKTSVMQLLRKELSDRIGEFEKKFKKMFPNCEPAQFIMKGFEGEDIMKQLGCSIINWFEESLEHVQSDYSKQQQVLSQLQNRIETLQNDEKIKISEAEESEKLRKANEIEKDSIVHKLSHCNLELEKKLKKIDPSYKMTQPVMESDKDRMQQVEYNLECLERSIKYLDQLQLECNRQQQMQLQKELDELKSELDVKTKKLKRSEEDNRILSKKLKESRTDFIPTTSKTDNVDHPVRFGLLGSGLYGEVHQVRYKNSSYAGKKIHSKVLSKRSKMKDTSNQKLQFQLAIECNSLTENLSHPNLEAFFEVVLSSANDVPMILTELMEKSLTEFVEHTKDTLYVNQEIDLCNDMAQGIAYLHSQSLVHRNLHDNNVLITRNGCAKIADYLCPLLFSDIAVDTSSGYVAPEIFQNKTAPSKESNIYTLGVLFLQVITKHPPPKTSELEMQHDFTKVPNHPLLPLIQECLKTKRSAVTHVCDELAQLIEEKDSPQRMAYKLLYTTEHKPLVATLSSGRRQELQHVSCESMPASMFWGYAVLGNETEVYVTGGNTHSGKAIENVYKFNMLLNQWDKLPSAGLEHGIPIMIDKKLSLIGGRRPGSKVVVNTVITYDDENGWIFKYPDMIQIRYRPAVVTFDDHVIVLGGRIKHRSTLTNSIEIMNIKERQWIKLATCLPHKMYDMQATVLKDCVWIFGYDDGLSRSNKVYSIPVERLTSNPTVKHTFKTIRHDTLYYKMSVVPNSYPPVVLGGDNWRNKPTSAVLVFEPKTESWNEVAYLSSPRTYCAVARVGECGMLVIGGCTETTSDKASSSSSLQTIELYYI